MLSINSGALMYRYAPLVEQFSNPQFCQMSKSCMICCPERPMVETAEALHGPLEQSKQGRWHLRLYCFSGPVGEASLRSCPSGGWPRLTVEAVAVRHRRPPPSGRPVARVELLGSQL